MLDRKLDRKLVSMNAKKKVSQRDIQKTRQKDGEIGIIWLTYRDREIF